MSELRKNIVIHGERYNLAVGQDGEGPPGSDTPGKVGVTYLDTLNKRLYVCTAAVAGDAGIVCEWTPAGDLIEATTGGNGSGENMNNVFPGKTAAFYGDSLTEANYHYTKGYHQWVKEILGLASYTNYGMSGYSIADVYNKVLSATDSPDVVFVMCGTNNQGSGNTVGTMGDSDTTTIYGALDLLCAQLKVKYPTAIVVFITPTYQTKWVSATTSYEIRKAILDVCAKYAIPVYDNCILSGLYATNLSVFTTDNVHWNDTTHEMVGKNLAAFLLNTFHYAYKSEDSGGEEGGDDNPGGGITPEGRIYAKDYALEPDGKYVSIGGELRTGLNLRRTEMIPVSPFSTIDIYSELQVPVAYYTADKTFIRLATAQSSAGDFITFSDTMPDGCAYIVFNVITTNIDKYYVDIHY